MRIEDARGDWALVTGASSGIGREFSCQLAARGLNVILVARREDRLRALAEVLRERHGVRCLVLAKDLAEADAPYAVQRAVEAEGLRVRVLVNNAAFSPWGRFERTPAEAYGQLVQVTVMSTLILCRILLPQLSSFPSSAVINLSSGAAVQPVCFLAAYAASKAFIHHFSLALHQEWRQRGITVQTLVPGPTESELHARGGAYLCKVSSRLAPPAVAVGKSLRGLASGRPLVVTERGFYRRRALVGLAPTGMLLHAIEGLFLPPEEGRPRQKTATKLANRKG